MVAAEGAGPCDAGRKSASHFESPWQVYLCRRMALGLRVLAIEFLPVRERTRVAVSLCAAFGFAVAAAFLLNLI